MSVIEQTREAASKPAFNEPALREAIRRLRNLSDMASIKFLAVEYLCLAATIGGAITLLECRAAWGLHPL